MPTSTKPAFSTISFPRVSNLMGKILFWKQWLPEKRCKKKNRNSMITWKSKNGRTRKKKKLSAPSCFRKKKRNECRQNETKTAILDHLMLLSLLYTQPQFWTRSESRLLIRRPKYSKKLKNSNQSLSCPSNHLRFKKWIVHNQICLSNHREPQTVQRQQWTIIQCWLGPQKLQISITRPIVQLQMRNWSSKKRIESATKTFSDWCTNLCLESRRVPWCSN